MDVLVQTGFELEHSRLWRMRKSAVKQYWPFAITTARNYKISPLTSTLLITTFRILESDLFLEMFVKRCSISDSPEVSTDSTWVHSGEGQSASLTCRVLANPGPKVRGRGINPFHSGNKSQIFDFLLWSGYHRSLNFSSADPWFH